MPNNPLLTRADALMHRQHGDSLETTELPVLMPFLSSENNKTTPSDEKQGEKTIHRDEARALANYLEKRLQATLPELIKLIVDDFFSKPRGTS